MARRGVMRDAVRDLRGGHARLAEAEVPAGVADDQVIEQRYVEDVGCLCKPASAAHRPGLVWDRASHIPPLERLGS